MDLAHASAKKERFDDAVFASINLEHRRLEVERELQSLKWVGYRFLTPLAATRLFYDEYRAQRLDYVREHNDIDLADSLPSVSFGDFIENPANLASAWSARQAADTHGVPYSIYIGFSLWFWSRRSGGGRARVPQINQLGYTDRTQEAWLAEFDRYAKEHIELTYRSLADVPQLLVSAFVGTPDQEDARDAILGHCRRSSASLATLMEMWCCSYPILTPDCFERVFPKDAVASAMESVDIPTATRASTPPGSPLSWPGCHGLPNTLEAAHEQCANCAFAESCGKIATMVKTEVVRRTGLGEPRKAKLRATANRRMRELRARRKAATARTSPAISSLPGAASSLPEAVSYPCGGDASLV